ncbi:MAG TPA: sugar MFS transporter [Hyphomonadaceae bacterium]|jgi:FHS family L-fucose permease-like MFS transporter|nr:sugar MFS transporter [Hyphomonadaceae bacterium]
MTGTGRSAEDAGVPNNPAYLSFFVFGLFFIFGGITSLNDVLVPKLKGLFTLNYFEAMLIQFAFFAAYAIISLPATAILKRVGYMRTAAIGLLTMTAGCLLFVPASSFGVFGMFLLALFVLAAGITTVQVVANPLITMLGKPSSAHSRLTFAQAFNSLGTTIFPYVGSAIILGSIATIDPATLSGAALDAFRSTETQVISNAYLGLAAAIAIVAIVVWLSRKKLTETPPEPTKLLQSFDLLRRPRFAWGALCIFLYVGGEVAIGSLIVNYLQEANVLGLSEELAGKHVPYYWGGALIGRFVGAGLLRLFSPGKLLAVFATGVITLILISANTTGAVSGWSLLSIGLFNSIMFPTIFSLASEKLGRRAADGSGIICVAIVGGAFVPLLTGYAADVAGLKTSLMVPALCYAVILAYGIYTRRPAQEVDIAPKEAPAASV